MGLKFNGTSDRMETANYNIASTTSPLSMNAWIQRAGTPTNFNGIIAHTPVVGNSGPFFYRSGEGGHVNELAVYSGVAYFFSGYTIGTGIEMVTLTYDGTNLRMYANGVLQSTDATTISSGNTGFNIAGGWGIGDNNHFFEGDMWDIGIWSRALSGDEIKILYESMGRDNILNGLVGRWRMNEKPDSVAASGASSIIDISKNGRHGSPVSSPDYIASAIRIVKPVIT